MNVKQFLGEELAMGTGECSLTYRNNAPNDKTYKTIILGINRIFVDAIPVEKQNEIITNNAIPEDVSELDYTFYTICLSGTYYVIKSVGEFKLYEEAILRVPNGNWSDMFLEVAKSNGNNVNIPKIFRSVTEPSPQEYQINIGDYWAQLDNLSDKNITAFWEYQHDEEEDEDLWICLFNVRAGGDLTIYLENAIIVQRDDLL